MTRPATPDIPTAADEATTLTAFLDFYRAELLDRAWGLDRDQLNRTLPPSTLSIARLIGHMTLVESDWFAVRFDGEAEVEPFASLDWDADGDAEMTRAESLPAEQLVAEFEAACADARRRVAAADSLDQASVATDPAGNPRNLRWIVVHMIEEYARHCGHADLIRESIDGDTAR